MPSPARKAANSLKRSMLPGCPRRQAAASIKVVIAVAGWHFGSNGPPGTQQFRQPINGQTLGFHGPEVRLAKYSEPQIRDQ